MSIMSFCDGSSDPALRRRPHRLDCRYGLTAGVHVDVLIEIAVTRYIMINFENVSATPWLRKKMEFDGRDAPKTTNPTFGILV